MALGAGAASYMRNVGRSFMYSTADVLKDNTPFLNSLFKESKETVNDLYKSIKDFSSGKGAEIKAMGKDVISTAWGNLKDDLKTGNWYNKERDQVFDEEMMKMMGFDMEDMDFSFDEDNFDFGDDSDDITDGDELIVKQNAKNTAATIMAVDKVGAKVASSVNQGTAASANYIVNSTRVMNQALYKLNSKGFATITEAIATLNKNTIGMSEAIAKPLTTFMQNGTLFMTKTTESLDKITKALETIVARTPDYSKTSKSSSSANARDLASIMSGGGFSASAYRDMVSGNVKEYTDMITGILGMFGGGKNLKNASSLAKGWSPLRVVTTGIMKSVIPAAFATSLRAFDESLKNFIPSAIAKEMGRSGSGGFLNSIIRAIFLPKNTFNRDVSRNYNQGPIPFDGQTKKAITEVIPDYLAHILSAINGSEVTKYDYKNARYTKISDIAKIKSSREREYADRAGGAFKRDALSLTGGNKRQQEELENFFLEVFLTGNIPDINKRGFSTSKLGKGLSSDTIRILRRVLRSDSGRKGKYNTMPADVMLQRAEMTRLINELGLSGTSLETALTNNSNYLKGKGAVGGVDKYGNSSSDYLRGIYQNTMGGYRGGPTLGNKSSGFDMPRFNIPGESSRSRGKGKTNTPTSRSQVNLDSKESIEAWNRKIDKDIQELGRQYNRYISKNGKSSSGTEREFENKLAKLKDEYIDADSDLRGESVLRTQGLVSHLDDAKDKTKDIIQKGLRKVLPEQVIDFLDKPITAVTNLLNTMTESMTSFLWGDGTRDGIFEQVRKKISAAIDKNETLSKFMDNLFGERDENGKRTGFWKDTKAGLREYWDWFKSGFGFGSPPTAEDKLEAQLNNFAANGRRVTKSGVVSVSRGELIIPSNLNPFYRGGYSRKQQLRREAMNARRFYGLRAGGGTALNSADLMAEADLPGVGATRQATTTETAAGIKAGVKNELYKMMDFLGGGFDPKTKQAFTTFVNNAGPDIKAARGRIGAGGIIGAGIGGFLGGPLLGMIVGSAAGFVSKSEKAQKFLFGDIDEETGDYQGGLFGKNMSNFLTKVAPEMARGGTAGLIGGSLLIGGPLGMVGGLVAGTALGFAKKSGALQEFLFGKGNPDDPDYKKGLFDRAKFDKAMPKAIVGAGLGILLGPAGALGGGMFTNMVLGAGLGLLTSSERVHTFLFGDGKDKKGMMVKLRDKLFGGVEDLFMNTANHLKVTFENIAKNILTKASNVGSWFRRRRARKGAMDNATPTFLRRIGTGVGKAAKYAGLGLGGTLLGLPFMLPFLPYIAGGAALTLGPRALANSRMKANARRGYNVYSNKLKRNMTAAERVEFRNRYQGTKGLSDKWQSFDDTISGFTNANDLQKELDAISGADEANRGLKSFTRDAQSAFYNSVTDDSLTSAEVNRLASLIKNGDVSGVEQYLRTINANPDTAASAWEQVNAVSQKKNEIEKTHKATLSKYGLKSAKDITKAQDLIKNEINALTHEQRIESDTSDIRSILMKIEEDGIKIRGSERRRRKKESNALDNIPSGLSDENTGMLPGGELNPDAKVGTEVATTTEDGEVIKYTKGPRGWLANLKDKITKKHVEAENEEEENASLSTRILSKISSGFTSVKDKIIGKASAVKESVLDKLKKIGKTALFAAIGLPLLPSLLPVLYDTAKWFFNSAVPWLGENIPKAWEWLTTTGKEAIVGIFDFIKNLASNVYSYFKTKKDGAYTLEDPESIHDIGALSDATYESFNKDLNWGEKYGNMQNQYSHNSQNEVKKDVDSSKLISPFEVQYAGTFTPELVSINGYAATTGGNKIADVRGLNSVSVFAIGGLLPTNNIARHEYFTDFVKLKTTTTTKKNGSETEDNNWIIKLRVTNDEWYIFCDMYQNDSEFRNVVDTKINGGWNNCKRQSYNLIFSKPSVSTDLHRMMLNAAKVEGSHSSQWLHALSSLDSRGYAKKGSVSPVTYTIDETTGQLSYEYSTGSNGSGGRGVTLAGKGSGLAGRGSGFVSQLDPAYASRSYGGFSTAQAGCAPAVASMAASLYGKNLSMSSAINAGKGFTSSDGTDTSYFGSALGKAGISTSYADSNTMMNDLAHNRPTILLGQDRSNTSKANSPFGPNGHYVLAEGFDRNGNVIIDDPELSGPRSYSPGILNSLSAAIRTGKGSGLYATNNGGSREELPHNLNTKAVFIWLVNHGYSPATAAGIMGNMWQESRLNPKIIQNGTGPAAGIAQWENYSAWTRNSNDTSRFGRLAKHAASKGRQWTDLESQMEFLDSELSGADIKARLGLSGSYRNSYLNQFRNAGLSENDAISFSSFKQLTDPFKAARYFMAAFERPNPAHSNIQGREEAASGYLQLYSDLNTSTTMIEAFGKYGSNREIVSSTDVGNGKFVNVIKDLNTGKTNQVIGTYKLNTGRVKVRKAVKQNNKKYTIYYTDGTVVKDCPNEKGVMDYKYDSTNRVYNVIYADGSKEAYPASTITGSIPIDSLDSGYESSSSSSSSGGTNLLSGMINIISTMFRKILGENVDISAGGDDSLNTTSGGYNYTPSYIPPQDSRVSAAMNQLVKNAASREKQEKYSQGYRERTINGVKYSDCSSFAQRMYKNTFGIDIGGYTGAQWANAINRNNNMVVVDSNRSNRPDISKLRAGDLLYWWSPGSSNKDQVGHVELYDGSGKLIGQEGPDMSWGPTIKNYSSYTAGGSIGGSNDRYLGAVRYLGDGSSSSSTSTSSAINYDTDSRFSTGTYSGGGRGFGSGLPLSNAYNSFIGNRLAGGASDLPRNNTVVINNGSKKDYTLEQLVGAILDLLRRLVDNDGTENSILANISNNTQYLSTINTFLSKYKDYQKAKANAASKQNNNQLDDGFKSTVDSLGAMAKF